MAGSYTCLNAIFASNASYIGSHAVETFGDNTIVGGQSNTITKATHNAILGGRENTINGNNNTNYRWSTIIGGYNNNILESGASQIIGSSYSDVRGGSRNSAIVGSQGSYLAGSTNSHIFGDCNRYVSNAYNKQYFRDISKNTGSFVIDHPNPQKEKTHKLIHFFVEAPTAGENIYRYEITIENGVATKQLPGYFKFLNKNVSFKITGKDHFGIANAKLDDTADNVLLTADTDGIYNLLIIGTRKDPGAISSWRGAEVLID